MYKKRVWRYYCDYCGKSNCSAAAIKQHEYHCTMNPDRTCRMCKTGNLRRTDLDACKEILPDGKDYEATQLDPITGTPSGISYGNLGHIIEKLLPYLRELTDNCPACILAALRQKNIPIWEADFHFDSECKHFWTEVNEINNYDEEPW